MELGLGSTGQWGTEKDNLLIQGLKTIHKHTLVNTVCETDKLEVKVKQIKLSFTVHKRETDERLKIMNVLSRSIESRSCHIDSISRRMLFQLQCCKQFVYR